MVATFEIVNCVQLDIEIVNCVQLGIEIVNCVQLGIEIVNCVQLDIEIGRIDSDLSSRFSRLPLQMASHCRSPDTTARHSFQFKFGSKLQNGLSHQRPGWS